jgi:hypothetical protein
MRRLALVIAASWVALTAPALSADPPEVTSARPAPDHQRLGEQLRERAAALASALPSGLALPSAAPSSLPSGARLHPLPLAAELARKWRERASDREARRAKHRARLVHEYGARLTLPEVKSELALHARRLAELSRVEFLAQHARAGADRERLLSRVSKLRETEQRRHQRAMERLMAVRAAAAASAPPSAAPAASAPK